MAGIGRKLTCAVVSPKQDSLSSNPFLPFQQFSDPTVFTEGGQEFNVYPVWPGQRALAVAFDAVLFLPGSETRTVMKEFAQLADVCHRYFLEPEDKPESEYFKLVFRPVVLRDGDCQGWKERLVEDYQAFSKKLLAFFQLFDPENTGSFTVNTFSSKMAETVEALGSTILQHLYEDIDRQRDFKIDLDEFETWWRKGRKGESRMLIDTAVAKFQPWETSLRDFKYDEHSSFISLRTDDSLEKRVKIEVVGKLGVSEELAPHVKGRSGSAWGLLLDASDAQGPLFAEFLESGMTETRSGNTVALTSPQTDFTSPDWTYYHFTLQSALDVESLPTASILPGLFASYSFEGVSNAKEGRVVSAKRCGAAPSFVTDVSESRKNIPAELVFFCKLLSDLAATQGALEAGRLERLPGDKLRVFWLTPTSSAIMQVDAKGWQKVLRVR